MLGCGPYFFRVELVAPLPLLQPQQRCDERAERELQWQLEQQQLLQHVWHPPRSDGTRELVARQNGRRQCTIIKGGRILSKACAWADDKHITPRRAVLDGTQPAAVGERAGVRHGLADLPLSPASQDFR